MRTKFCLNLDTYFVHGNKKAGTEHSTIVVQVAGFLEVKGTIITAIPQASIKEWLFDNLPLFACKNFRLSNLYFLNSHLHNWFSHFRSTFSRFHHEIVILNIHLVTFATSLVTYRKCTGN